MNTAEFMLRENVTLYGSYKCYGQQAVEMCKSLSLRPVEHTVLWEILDRNKISVKVDPQVNV